MELVLAILIVGALIYAWQNRPQAKMRRTVKANQAAARACPHCKQRGLAVPYSAAGNVPKLLLGIFALGVWKTYRCTNCGYRW